MTTCKVTILDEVNVKISNLDLDTRKALVKKFKYEDPSARFRPSYKLGRWDGSVSFFGLGGTTYLSMLEPVLEYLEQKNYYIEVEDLREVPSLEFTKIACDYWGDQTWPQGHRYAGEKIRLRDDQVEVINKFLEHPQALQEIATGFGKCLAGDTDIEINFARNSKFSKFISIIAHPDSTDETLTGLILPIAKFASLIEACYEYQLQNQTAVTITDLGVYVSTPTGLTQINEFIKKFDLPMLKVVLSNGYTFKAATNHIVRKYQTDVYLKDVCVGDQLDHCDILPIFVTDIQPSDNEDCYDIAIDAPHLYFDANGLVHHNTITTATLAKICEKYGRTITIVPNKSLVEQTEEDFVNCQLDVGVYYGNRKDLNKTHTICTWQSLNILDKKSHDSDDVLSLTEFLDGVQAVVVDECHQASAEVLKKLLTKNLSKVPIRWGLTGTIPKQDFEFQSLRASLGDVIHRVYAHELQEKGVLSNCVVNIIQTAEWREFSGYSEELKFLVTDESRMKYISGLIKDIADTGNTLVLVNRIDTGKFIVEQLPDAVFVSGAVKTKDRKDEYDEIKIANNKIIVATYGVASVGINIPRIFNMVLLEPGKSFVRVIQSIGRGLRKAADKDHVNIYDITATTKYAKRHLTERKRFYKDAKYEFNIKKVDRPI